MNFPWPAVPVPGGPWPRTNEWEITSTLMRSGHRQGSTETIDPEAPVTRTHTHTHTVCVQVCVCCVCVSVGPCMWRKAPHGAVTRRVLPDARPSSGLSPAWWPRGRAPYHPACTAPVLHIILPATPQHTREARVMRRPLPLPTQTPPPPRSVASTSSSQASRRQMIHCPGGLCAPQTEEQPAAACPAAAAGAFALFIKMNSSVLTERRR